MKLFFAFLFYFWFIFLIIEFARKSGDLEFIVKFLILFHLFFGAVSFFISWLNEKEERKKKKIMKEIYEEDDYFFEKY